MYFHFYLVVWLLIHLEDIFLTCRWYSLQIMMGCQWSPLHRHFKIQEHYLSRTHTGEVAMLSVCVRVRVHTLSRVL